MELAYADDGADRLGPPLVLLHAFPLSGAMFGQLAGRLAATQRVITPDLRGFGDSPDPGADEPSLELMADDVVALLDRLDIDRAMVAGVSMGGYVAMAMLRRVPERVAAVALIDTKASADADEARANRERVAQAVLNNGPRALRPMLDTLLGDTTRKERPEIVAQVTGWLDAARPKGVAWAQRAMAARPSSFDVLASAKAPVTVIVGAEDTLTPREDAVAIAEARVPPAPLRVLAGAGHLSPVEDPDAVAGALRDVLL